MRAWKTLARQVVWDESDFLTLEVHTVELPDGRVISDWPWAKAPDYVNVAAITDEGRFLVFRQVKYGVEGESLAPVGGYLEPGEEPLSAARRELLEETGYQAARWTGLGRYRVDGNRGVGMAYFFLAEGAQHVAMPEPDDLEEQELLLLSRREVDAALAAGRFKLLPWAAIMALAVLHLDD
jgi:ADP-ribose pyrophosphatase